MDCAFRCISFVTPGFRATTAAHFQKRKPQPGFHMDLRVGKAPSCVCTVTIIAAYIETVKDSSVLCVPLNQRSHIDTGFVYGREKKRKNKRSTVMVDEHTITDGTIYDTNETRECKRVDPVEFNVLCLWVKRAFVSFI